MTRPKWRARRARTPTTFAQSYYPEDRAHAESPGVGTLQAAEATPMATPLKKQVGSGPLPGDWESLCLDMRKLVLSKVPLRHLAPAAATCREFREDFRRRVPEERERLISVAEARYGKDVVAAFVKAVQDSICCVNHYKHSFLREKEFLVTDASGAHECVSDKVVNTRLRDGCLAVFTRRDPFLGKHRLMTNRPEGEPSEIVKINVWRTGTFYLHIKASMTWGTGEAEMGIFLAICTRERGPLPPGLSHRHRWSMYGKSPQTIRAVIGGPKIRWKFDGPLGRLADTFFLYTL